MSRPPRSARDRPVSVLSGSGVALLILAVTAALVTLDHNGELRAANDQLDLVAQGMVEKVHDEIRDIGLLLLSAERVDEGGEDHLQGRLDVISALPMVSAVGHASSDRAEVVWSRQVLSTTLTPIGPEMISDANARPEQQMMYRNMGEYVLVAHPYISSQARMWDLVLVDMNLAASNAVPRARAADLVWDFRPLRGSESLTTPEPDIHREYMILGGSTAWVLEMSWTPQALRHIGVGVDWIIGAVGVVLAGAIGWLTARWMQRRYLEADLRATKDLIEQKDLLLLAISHQMRTPLTGIIGFLRLALDEPDDQLSIQQRRDLGRLALGEAELVAEIVEDLLLSIRMQDQQLVVVASVMTVEGLLADVFRATARGAETLSFSDPSSETQVVADPLRVRQLLRNILSGGRDEGARHWEASLYSDGDMVTLSLVPDVVVSPRSERLTPDQVAMPYGLSTVQPRLGIARKLSELMGGRLVVVQRKGDTEIKVTLPAAPLGRDDSIPFGEEPAMVERVDPGWLTLRRDR